jgi:hypothetical protein
VALDFYVLQGFCEGLAVASLQSPVFRMAEEEQTNSQLAASMHKEDNASTGCCLREVVDCVK